MKRRLSSSFDSLTAFLYFAACALSTVMLLSLPAARAHNFGAHFRTPEVRRAVERHTSIAHSDCDAPARVAKSHPLARFFAPTETAGNIVLADNFESASDVLLPRLLNRLKLNPSGSNGEDPLLQA
jgi:hypothetical protein